MQLAQVFSSERKNFVINFFISLIPVAFILGNLSINFNILLIIIFSLIFYFKKIDFYNFIRDEKILVSFFIFVIFTGVWNHVETYSKIENDENVVILKSFLFLKFLFLTIIMTYLVREKIFNFKWFFLSCAFCSAFVSVDIIYQLLFSKDIFGIEPLTQRKLSGPFGDELIAGGYIQRFSIFAFFSIPLFLKIKQPYLSIFIGFLFVLFFLSIILSGNRMPLILFLLTILFILIFEKNVRKYVIPIFLISFLLVGSSYIFNKQVKINFDHLTRNIKSIINVFLIDVGKKDQILTKVEVPLYYQEFRSFYETWKMNKFIGGGVKSFRENCKIREIKNTFERINCNTHPHNYYLEIMTDLGIVGLIFILIIFIKVIIQSFLQNYKDTSYSNKAIVAILFLFIVEIIPIRSSGSFFTTGSITFIFLLFSILLGSLKKKI